MNMHEMKKLGITVSRFGMGAMRLPTEGGKVDHSESIKMMRYAIDNGVNYIDTAYVYHGGESEVVVGEALKDGYRARTYLASKSPVWMVEKYEDYERLLDEQLKRLGTDCIDFYLLHALDSDTFPQKVLAYDAPKFLEDMKRKGKIRFSAFSFHDVLDCFKGIIDLNIFDMCQIQLNYLDDKYQAGIEGMKYASGKGLEVVVMEPLRGGRLADVPEAVRAHFAAADPTKTPAQWAFSYLANMPEVSLVLSGVSTMQQLKENIATFSAVSPGCMLGAERQALLDAKAIFDQRMKIGCTNCQYCMPCLQDVNIAGVFWQWNEAGLFDKWAQAKPEYAKMLKNGSGADKCIACGACEERCPQALHIIESLKAADAELTV